MNEVQIMCCLCMLMCLALTLNANIAEFDEYWHKRRLEAVKYFEEAYHPEPYNVTNHFNHQVHL